jgi:hypothetical protein
VPTTTHNPAPPAHVGGSFAPPLSDAKLKRYKELITKLPAGPLKDCLSKLYKCCSVWWEIPVSKGAGTPHRSGRGLIVKLDPEVRSALDEHVPWNHELDSMHGFDPVYSTPRLLDAIDPKEQKELRDAAFHLLWHVKELAIGPDEGEWGREPITADQLGD